MNRAPRLAIALLLVASLAAAHGGAGLVRTVAEVGDGGYCCCPSPEECRCTANCCSHGPDGAANRAPGGDGGPSLLSSISCHFQTLPDGSLSGAIGKDISPSTVASGVRDAEPPDPSDRASEFDVACQYDSHRLAGSPRAPPSPSQAWC